MNNGLFWHTNHTNSINGHHVKNDQYVNMRKSRKIQTEHFNNEVPVSLVVHTDILFSSAHAALSWQTSLALTYTGTARTTSM